MYVDELRIEVDVKGSRLEIPVSLGGGYWDFIGSGVSDAGNRAYFTHRTSPGGPRARMWTTTCDSNDGTSRSFCGSYHFITPASRHARRSMSFRRARQVNFTGTSQWCLSGSNPRLPGHAWSHAITSKNRLFGLRCRGRQSSPSAVTLRFARCLRRPMCVGPGLSSSPSTMSNSRCRESPRSMSLVRGRSSLDCLASRCPSRAGSRRCRSRCRPGWAPVRVRIESNTRPSWWRSQSKARGPPAWGGRSRRWLSSSLPSRYPYFVVGVAGVLNPDETGCPLCARGGSDLGPLLPVLLLLIRSIRPYVFHDPRPLSSPSTLLPPPARSSPDGRIPFLTPDSCPTVPLPPWLPRTPVLPLSRSTSSDYLDFDSSFSPRP